MRDEQGEPLYYVSQILDISARKTTDLALALLNTRLEQSNRELQDFATVASHDFQEPLRKIQAFSDRLRTRYPAALDAEGHDYLARVQQAARRMQTLINDLLAFARISSRSQPFTQVDLGLEDDAPVRSLIESVLRMGGYAVLSAAGGAEAMALAKAHPGPIELLLTDVIMPGMSGVDLVRALAGSRPELRVLYISGYTDDAISPHGLRSASVAFLQKPFSPDELARRCELCSTPLSQC